MIQLHSGDSKLIQLTIKDISGNLVDLTGADFIFGLSKKPYSEVMFTKNMSGTSTYSLDLSGSTTTTTTSASPIIIKDFEKSVIEIKLDNNDTKNLVGEYYVETKQIDQDGNRITLMTDKLVVNPSILL